MRFIVPECRFSYLTNNIVSSLDALIFPRCFNNVFNTDDKVVNVEYQIKSKCLYHREFVQGAIMVMKLVWNKKKKVLQQQILHRQIYLFCQCFLSQIHVNAVFFPLLLLVKYHSLRQMSRPKLNPLSMKHGVGCGVWQLCAFIATHGLTLTYADNHNSTF